MTQSDGTTQKIDRRHKNRQYSDQQRGLGGVQESSGCNGFESLGVNPSDCSREDSSGASYDRNTPLGKILQRLKLIEEAHLTYVHNHRQRLETRLEENLQSEETFRRQVTELEQEIYNLATQTNEEQNKSDS